MNALRSIVTPAPEIQAKSVDVDALAGILFYSAGITRKMKSGWGTHYMRAAPATGALYPIELYVISGDVKGLKAGIYHFNPLEFALTEIRSGDFRNELAIMSDVGISTAPLTMAFTSLAWRNAWKYQARSYRHWFWDAGVIAANLLATTVSAELLPRLVLGFVDHEVNRLLCLDEKQEATVALASIGMGIDEPIERGRRSLHDLQHKVKPLSKEMVEYPMIWKMHDASSLKSEDEVKAWVLAEPTLSSHEGTPSKLQVQLVSTSYSLGEVILRRGSTRRFSQSSITLSQISTILKASMVKIPFDFSSKGLVEIYLIANSVDGLESGAYFFNHESGVIERLKAGYFRNVSGYLCLEQQLFSDASAVFYLMADLQAILKALGDRGYRASQFEAGVRAGKIYLASYSLDIGASGSTFYDDAVTEFFSPHAKDKSPMIAVGIGIPAYRARSGNVLPQMESHS
jgi:SagB-type dehydrogenase family enzyme